jgi:EAL domain-containing protein (putative c-di-GMP-specific phosphodiesterase class I)/ActR/RegA family two-component response regulator
MQPTEQAPSRTAALPTQVVLLLDDDLAVTEGLGMGLERTGRTVITCNDLESAQLATEWLSPSHIVSDIRLSGAFAYEGLDFIRYAKRLLPDSPVILITGDAPEALQLEASERGAFGFLKKPFETSELDALIDLLACPRPVEAGSATLVRIPVLGQIIHGTGLYSAFQPIVELGEQWLPFGYESLARYRTDSPLQYPERLFQYAERKNKVSDLELACVARALSTAVPLVSRGILFLNIHPTVFADGSKLLDLFKAHADQTDIPLTRVVLEVTEQAALPDKPIVFENIAGLRSLGVRFAFDDFGVAYSHLPLIDRLRPSFLKISQHFGTGFETDSTKVKIVTNFVSIARDFDCQLIMEGIEDASTAEAAASLGIRYGQGFFFGRPTEVGAFSKSASPAK